MAADRPHRANAGRNIGKLLDQEQDADDFYKTAYGGFEEVSGDEEYEVRGLAGCLFYLERTGCKCA